MAPRSPRSISAPSLAIGVAFGNGVLSFASPCSVALLPAYLVVVTHRSPGTDQRARGIVVRSLVFTAALSVVFAALGSAAGAGTTLQTTGETFDRVAGGVLVVVALVLVAAARLESLRRSSLGPVVLGALFAAAFASSMGPFVAVMLKLAADTRSGPWGAVLLIAYAVGLSLPFVICTLVVAGSEPAVRILSRGARELCFGASAVLAVVAVVLLVGRYGVVTDWLDRVLPFASQ